jgi:TonB family protein
VDPRLLRKLAPPHEMQPPPGPAEPERVTPPATKAPETSMAPPSPQPRTQPPQDSPLRPQPPPQDNPSSGLVLPRFSPGRALQESLHEALKDGGSSSAQFGGPTPGGGGMGGGGGGGGGQGYLGGNVEILTPTEGVDFSTYIARVLASVKRNWYSVMPESARLGDRGRVVLQFHIMRNGVVPDAEPAMAGSSGKDPLDRAAVSAIRSSTPFEPLPPAFSGPYIELRFIFLYNLPLSSQ